jgi:hypothetical protein
MGWILFEDAELSATRWTRRRWTQVGRLTGALHESLNLDAAQVSCVSLVSHTPSLGDVLDVVQSGAVGDALRCLRKTFRLSFGQFDVLRDLLAGVGQWSFQEWMVDTVWCHGDLHLNNIMSSRSLHALFIIDWAFLHRDVAYFDLFRRSMPQVQRYRCIDLDHALTYCVRITTAEGFIRPSRGGYADTPDTHRFIYGGF